MASGANPRLHRSASPEYDEGRHRLFGEGIAVVRARIFVAALIAIGGALVWADSPPAPQPATAEIEQLIRDLGDKRFPVREQASKKLWQIGAAAEPALRRALKDPDVEIAQRSKALLDKFAWGIFPDTPDTIVAELERYRDGDDDVRGQSANALADKGPAGFKALGRLRARAHSDKERHFLADAMTQATVKALPALLKARDYDALESLLEACLDREADDALANYTALMILRDKLPAALKRWQAEYEAAPSPRSSELLAYLHRAAGNLAEARRFAAVREELLDDILWELGDWAALATRPVSEQPRGADRRVPVELAVKAAYLRLAGDGPASAAHVEKLRNVDDPNEEWTVVKGLLLNERPTEALERLAKSPVIRDVAFDLLVAQMRYREAFALADKPAGEGEEDDRRKFTVRHARALYLIGEHDQAGQLFARVASELKSPVDGETAADLIQTQVRLGLRDAAREAAATYLGVLSRLAVDSAADPTRRVLEALFPKRGVEAKTWWQFLRQKFPKDDERAAMRRLRGLLEGGDLAPTDLADLTAGVLAAARDDDPNAAIRTRLAAASAEETAGQFDPAIKHLTDAAQLSREASVCIRLGDLLVARKRYAEAEEAYGKAAARDTTDALPVYLQGWALIQAGQKAAGETMIEQARLLTLGDTRRRAAVAEELTKRDLLDLARRERDLVRQLGWHRAWAAGGYLSYLARDSAARKDYARAADSYDRVIVGVLGNDFQFVENSAYLSVPALARAYRARAALAAGKLDVVRSEAEACLTLTPGNLDLAILLVPEFVKRGRTADADALYARSAGAYADLCKNHPASAFAHNSAAWLAACCRRDLDAALAHAEKATELAPKYAGYRDTLAEVYFQRGDKAKAISLMKECQRMEPKNEYFVKQLARFEAGDPSVPPPPEVDDN
jgi:tetratricopeptide (TPR) repeat protein